MILQYLIGQSVSDTGRPGQSASDTGRPGQSGVRAILGCQDRVRAILGGQDRVRAILGGQDKNDGKLTSFLFYYFFVTAPYYYDFYINLECCLYLSQYLECSLNILLLLVVQVNDKQSI